MKANCHSRAVEPVSCAGRIVLLYVVVAALWILFSDAVVEWVAGSWQAAALFQTVKGLAFVLVTAALLLAMIWRAGLPVRWHL